MLERWFGNVLISIHALREEGDLLSRLPRLLTSNFYPRPPRGGRQWRENGYQHLQIFLSTPSARRATRSRQRAGSWQTISIHALREEGDG